MSLIAFLIHIFICGIIIAGIKQSARTYFNPGRSKVPWVNKMHMHAINHPPTFASKAMVQLNVRPTLQLGKQLQPKGHHIPVTTPVIKPLQQKQVIYQLYMILLDESCM